QAHPAALQQRANDDHAMFGGKLAEPLGAGTRDRPGAVELGDVLAVAEVRAVVQFLQQHQPGSLAGGLCDPLADQRKVGVGVALVALLDERYGKDLLHPPIVGRRLSTGRLPATAWSGSGGFRSAR